MVFGKKNKFLICYNNQSGTLSGPALVVEKGDL